MHQTRTGGRGRRSPVRSAAAQAAGVALTLLLGAAPAHAIDVDAGDYTALPAGTNLGLLYYQHAQRDRVYAGGNRVAGGNLDSDVGIVRYVRSLQVLGTFGRDISVRNGPMENLRVNLRLLKVF
ncbi:hypothetical protein [Cupriavidus oxalaticus]|uniref:hypothetical protein n=1 Tax=Cupriavidus oxalaticus TaxID=96344 RepID=UPI003D187604